jgi:hypothetical protein
MKIGKNEPGERRAGLGGDGILKSSHNLVLTSPYKVFVGAEPTAQAGQGILIRCFFYDVNGIIAELKGFKTALKKGRRCLEKRINASKGGS